MAEEKSEEPKVESEEAAADQPIRRTDWGKVFRRSVIVLVALLVLIVGGLFLYINTDFGRAEIKRQLGQIQLESCISFDVERIEGSPIGELTLYNVRAYDLESIGGTQQVEILEGAMTGETEEACNDLQQRDLENPFLVLPQVELDWRPLVFPFTGDITIHSLVSEGGTLRRAPVTRATPSDGNIFPENDVRVDELRLSDLTIAPGVAGDEARTISLKGSTRFQRGNAVFLQDRIAVLRLEAELGGGDLLDVFVKAAPDAEVPELDIDGVYKAPAGGLLAAIAGAEESYSAEISGNGDWDRWSGQVAVLRDESPFLSAGLSKRGDVFAIKGEGASGRVLEGILARAFPSNTGVDIRGTVSGGIFEDTSYLLDLFRLLPVVPDDHERVDLNGSIVNEALAIGVDGGYDLVAGSAEDLTLAIDLANPGLISDDLLLRDAELVATLNGPVADLSIRHLLNVGEVDLGGTRLVGLAQRGLAQWDGTRLTVPLDGSVTRVISGNSFADGRLVGGRIGGMLVYSGQRLLSENLAIRFPGLDAQLALVGDLGNGRYGVSGPVRAQGLRIDNLGTVDVNSRIDFALAQGAPWTLGAQLDGRMASISNGTLETLSGGNIRFAGGVSLAQGRPVVFRDARIRANKLSADLDGRVDGGTTSLAGSGRHADYGPFTVDATLADDGPRATLVFADPLPAAGLKDVRVALAPTADGFAIETDGRSTLGAFDGELGLVSPPGGPTQIAVDRLRVWETNVTGTLTLGEGGADGSLAVNGGGLDGRIGLAATSGAQGFVVDLTARDSSFGGTTPIVINQADIDMRGQFGGGNSIINGTANAQGIRYGSVFIGRLAARAELEDGIGEIVASLAGRRGSRFALQTNTQLAPERIAIAAQGEFGGKQIRMPRRAVLTALDGGGWELAPSQIAYGNGGVVASGRFGGGTTDLDLQLDSMPLSLVDIAVADMGLGGSISGAIDFRQEDGSQPTGSANIKVAGLTRSGLVLASRPVDLSLNADLGASSLGFKAVIIEDGSRRGRAQGRIANLPANGGLMERLEAGALSAQLRYTGPADALWRLAAVEAFDLTGQVAVAANATGTLANPQIQGSLSGDSLQMGSTLTGTKIRDIAMRGRFSGSELRLTRFAGTAANGGSVSGSGVVGLENLGERGPRIDLRIAANNARLLDRADIKATLSGPMRILSDGNGGTIAGRVKIANASWKLGAAQSVVALPNIRTRDINLSADRAPIARRSGPWRYMINAETTGRIDVDGMGLDSEWETSNLRLRGTTDDPRIGGDVSYIRGSYSFAGTRFELTRGEIAFDENVPIDPRVNIRAETQQDGLDVQVRVTGNAQQPEVAFTSNPALPEEELLARLLFGGSITDLSATDALQLGAALASLRGGSGLDPINQLRTAIGLDRLRIVSAEPALDRGTAVALGKNITNRFYAEIITDGQGYSATEVEFRVTSWLSLLAAVSTVGRDSVSAEFRRDY